MYVMYNVVCFMCLAKTSFQHNMLLCWVVRVLVVLGVLAVGIVADTAKVKLVEVPHHSRYFPSTSTESPKPLVPRAPPAELSGPPHLQVLNGLCFKTKEKNYIYEVCPFHNVTQREDKAAWNRYQGIVGVWRQWIVEDDRIVGMHFAMGDKCGHTDRKVDVLFSCNTITELTNVTEPKTCNYHVWFYTPLACFKGAMQVYRVLTEQEIQQWDRLTEEYISDELTSLGLKRQREKLLLNAGLLYNFTKDIMHEASPTPALGSPSNDKEQKPSLLQCQQHVSVLEQQLADLKDELTVTKKVLYTDAKMVATVQKMLGNHTRPLTVNVTGPANSDTTLNRTIQRTRGDDQNVVATKSIADISRPHYTNSTKLIDDRALQHGGLHQHNQLKEIRKKKDLGDTKTRFISDKKDKEMRNRKGTRKETNLLREGKLGTVSMNKGIF